jgi:hypothetical protein
LIPPSLGSSSVCGDSCTSCQYASFIATGPPHDFEKGKRDAKLEKEAWRVGRKRVLMPSIPAFKSTLTKILSPVVARAQREIVVKSGILALMILSVFVGVVPAPWPDEVSIVVCPRRKKRTAM